MRICIAAENGMVCQHFGHCPEFAIFEVQEDGAKQVGSMPNPGHAPGTLPPILKEWGVTHVISGGMGTRAVELLQSMGIDVVTGAQGGLEETARALASGRLSPQQNICGHSGGGHNCGHGAGSCH